MACGSPLVIEQFPPGTASSTPVSVIAPESLGLVTVIVPVTSQSLSVPASWVKAAA